MNIMIQGQLDRVEVALNTLITSIESYNPSVPTAVDLLAADDELQQGVKLRKHLPGVSSDSNSYPHSVSQHQANHTRILNLRSTIEAHEQETKATLTLLAEARKDLLSTPTTKFPKTSRNVPFTELLDYAKNISRYTVPPTFSERPPEPKATATAPETDDAAPIANGAGDAVTDAREANAIANGEKPPRGEDTGVGTRSLEQFEVDWLNELAKKKFVPWPSEEVIKRGALGQIQVMLEQGVNPEAGGAAEEVARKIEEGEEGNDVQMGEGSMEAAVEAVQQKVDRRVEAPRTEEKPKVFKGLDLDEDSDED
ncbi:MAG: hypothetical protein Q9166_001539 [cf. Caloplaca sp. 2 TL-2023]